MRKQPTFCYTTTSFCAKWHQTNNCRNSLSNLPFLFAPRHWGRFARRNLCDSATETPYWWHKSIITIPVVIGFQMQICSILRFSRVPFDLCSLLPVNLKTIDKTMQLLHHLIRAYDWIPDRFYVISMEFLSLSRRRSSSWNISSREKQGDTAVFPGYCRNSMLIRPMAHM